MKSFIVASCLLLFGFLREVSAFECYNCNSNENEACIDLSDPQNLPNSFVVECEDYCTIVRTEYTDIPDEVISIMRRCEKEPLVANGVRTENHYTKMYTSCDTGRCNDGDGRRDPSDGDNYAGGRRTNVITVPEQNGGDLKKPFITILTGSVLVLLHNRMG